MSRFLISTLDAAGHVTPALPVAAALVARGHEVLWHCGPKYHDHIQATGATVVPAHQAPTMDELPVQPDPGATGAAAGASTLRRLTVDRMAGQLADYENIHTRAPLDAILVDLCSLGGRAFHEKHGVPWATLGISPLTMVSPQVPPFGSNWRPPTSWLGRARVRAFNRLGALVMKPVTTAYIQARAAARLAPLPRGTAATDHMFSYQMHLQAATRSLEYPRQPWPTEVHFVGPLLPGAPADTALPPWWPQLAQAKQVVHITQGTVGTDPAVLTRPAMQALADLDGLVVITTPDPAALGPIPANVRVAPFIPHALLLPHVHAMVTNGGYNGTKIALAHGVPLVFAPGGNDQTDVAGRVVWAGAGINLRKRTPTQEKIRAAVESVLTQPGYRLAAARIQAEFHQCPGGERAADLLESLVGQGTRPGNDKSTARRGYPSPTRGGRKPV